MKFLKWYGGNKFPWAAVPEIENVPASLVFYGTIQTDFVNVMQS